MDAPRAVDSEEPPTEHTAEVPAPATREAPQSEGAIADATLVTSETGPVEGVVDGTLGGVTLTVLRSDDSAYEEQFVLRPEKGTGASTGVEEDTVLRIGRSPQNEVRVKSSGVSVFHAEVRVRKGWLTKHASTPFRVRDLSMNGTGLKLPGGQKTLLQKGEEAAAPDGAMLLMPVKRPKDASQHERVWITLKLASGVTAPSHVEALQTSSAAPVDLASPGADVAAPAASHSSTATVSAATSMPPPPSQPAAALARAASVAARRGRSLGIADLAPIRDGVKRPRPRSSFVPSLIHLKGPKGRVIKGPSGRRGTSKATVSATVTATATRPKAKPKTAADAVSSPSRSPCTEGSPSPGGQRRRSESSDDRPRKFQRAGTNPLDPRGKGGGLAESWRWGLQAMPWQWDGGVCTEQIRSMYQRFKPSKLRKLDLILEKHKGREQKLLQKLCSKYLTQRAYTAVDLTDRKSVV